VGGVTPKAVANNASPDPIPLLMTRPRAASETFVASLSSDLRSHVTPIYSPLIRIAGLGVRETLTASDAAVFTSTNGVVHGPSGQGRPAYCVGAATTAAALKKGWNAQMRGETAGALVANLVQNRPPERLIHLSGVHTRGDICTKLKACGFLAHNIAVYDQIAQPLSADARAAIEAGNPLLVPLFSPRTSAQFLREASSPKSVYVVALSTAVAQELQATSFAGVTVASAPNADAMRAALASTLAALSSG